MLREKSLCVCELTAALEVSQPKMSRHLAALRERGIVEDRKVANRVFYRLNPALPVWAQAVVCHLAEGIENTDEFIADRKRLKAMPNRPDRGAMPSEWRRCSTETLRHADRLEI
jgi:ArsR family transcriptional regulator